MCPGLHVLLTRTELCGFLRTSRHLEVEHVIQYSQYMSSKHIVVGCSKLVSNSSKHPSPCTTPQQAPSSESTQASPWPWGTRTSSPQRSSATHPRDCQTCSRPCPDHQARCGERPSATGPGLPTGSAAAAPPSTFGRVPGRFR